MEKILKEVGVGEVFNIAGLDFIKFYDENGNTVAVAKDIWFRSVFGNNNNFAKSEILKKLNNEFLPKIEEAIGAKNIVEHKVDLLSLDGSDKWGKINCKISLPTFDCYRKNVKVFDKYKLKDWWWLATPDSTDRHYNDNWIVCVSPDGYIYFNGCNFERGVRPFLSFVSSISISCKE